MAILGRVNSAREPVVALRTAPNNRKISVIIDTGFSGALCLSPEIIDRMGFEHIGREAYILADGRIVHADIHRAEILWFNRKRSVEVIALENRQGLLGTQMLEGCRLIVQFRKRKLSIHQERR
jgi:clan AA aspartic protease